MAITGPEAWGPWGEPCVVITYGPSGVGKTMDAIYAFPDALFLAQKGALKPRNEVGLTAIWRQDLRTVDDVIALLWQIAKLAPADRPPAVVIDDLSLLAENTKIAMEASGKYSRNKFALWGGLKDKITSLANIARWEAGVHVLINAHETGPEITDAGQKIRGGPTMPSKKLSSTIPHVADVVLRGQHDPTRIGMPWQGVYLCALHDDWHMKNRHGQYGTLPLNLGELFRDAGYYMSRPHQWIEDWAEAIAGKLAAGASQADVKTLAKTRLLAKGYDPRLIRWAIRDGLDRAQLRSMRGKILEF